MSIYAFSAASPVSEVAFRYANDRPPVGLLSAAPGVGADRLAAIRNMLEAQGWVAVAASWNGKPVLQVSGFKNEGQLVAALSAQHFAEGAPQITPEAGDQPTLTYKEWLEDNSIRTGGMLNLVGDAGLLASGIMGGRSKEATAGLLYTAGALISTRYGNVKTEHHLNNVSAQMGEYLKAQAVELPEEGGLSGILKAHRGSSLKNAEDFLYRYPSQAMLGAYTLGAVSMLQSGMQHRKLWDTAYGVNSVATKVASLLVKEKPKDEKPEVQERSAVGRALEWVREKPLRIFGYGSLVSDVLLGLSAFREYRTNPAQKSYVFKFLTTGTYAMSDVMFAISSKNSANAGGKFDADEQRRIEALAAETIAAQPREKHAALSQQVSGFLTAQPEMNGTAAEIAKNIGRQVDAAGRNPWAARVARSATDVSIQSANGNLPFAL